MDYSALHSASIMSSQGSLSQSNIEAFNSGIFDEGMNYNSAGFSENTISVSSSVHYANVNRGFDSTNALSWSLQDPVYETLPTDRRTKLNLIQQFNRII